MSEKISNKNDLRYNDAGNVHMDFHGATNTTIEFIIKKYGIKIMDDIFFKVGKEVYKDFSEVLIKRYETLSVPSIKNNINNKIIIDEGSANLHPAWSEDGLRIAFLSNKDNDTFL